MRRGRRQPDPKAEEAKKALELRADLLMQAVSLTGLDDAYNRYAAKKAAFKLTLPDDYDERMDLLLILAKRGLKVAGILYEEET